MSLATVVEVATAIAGAAAFAMVPGRALSSHGRARLGRIQGDTPMAPIMRGAV